jgi:hypothetical protein
MDDNAYLCLDKQNLVGSDWHDRFKLWHKQNLEARQCYASDADFMLISRKPPGIVAFIDYKTHVHDRCMTFVECVAYDTVRGLGIPVYVVTSDPDFTVFGVYEYLGADTRPRDPVCSLRPVDVDITEAAYWEWEKGLRQAYSQDRTVARLSGALSQMVPYISPPTDRCMT